MASRPWIDKADDDLCPMIPLEDRALSTWNKSGIVLLSPPEFCSKRTREPRGNGMLDFLKNTSKARAIEVVPPSVHMPQHIAEKTLLLQLLERRGDGFRSTKHYVDSQHYAVLSENSGSWSGREYWPSYFFGECVMFGDVDGSGVSE